MKYYWHGPSLLEEMRTISNIERLKVSSAYFSQFGLTLLKDIVRSNNLEKHNVELFLSPEFSYNKPSILLQEASLLANVYIVESIPFHAKVYWSKLKDGSERMIFGSSNFTNGGFQKNIEFDMIKEITCTEESKKIEMFFDFCRNNASMINQEMILAYQENEKELEELSNLQNRLKAKLFSYAYKKDPFAKNDLDLANSYFTYEDYELFFSRNQKRKDSNIMKRREQLREKLLKIHHQLYLSKIKLLGLHCHKRKQNVCSLITPCDFNKNRVSWMGIRYGKSATEVDYWNEEANKNDEFAFQKHACLQFSITASGIQISLFHSVANGGFDRGYVREQLTNAPSYRTKLIGEIHNLKGNGFTWKFINFANDNVDEFSLDHRNANDFIAYYLENDEEGKESFLSYVFKPDSIEIKDLESLKKNILIKIKQLLPLYRLMALRVKAPDYNE
ncbi:phospholipase D family protein (plasmid) [Paenibacillus thiaminolyticus]|uniref:phospholipase D family protein n=1 Tax=Paenibacillus thiaminolyticus TaxID=49283 RepID=UPI00232B7F18|nr:phospholipase D family protein [Paenibacillus thiaminolyticus]WCF11551.1 phospholipase D family protein [Paenibacillus thiaminolyticus]